MKIKCDNSKVMNDGELWLCLRVKDIRKAREITDLINSEPHEYTAEVKKHYERRSKDANAYAWALIGKLAEKLNLSDIETYKEYIRKCGVHRQIEINAEAYKTFETVWGEHGLGWVCEKVDYSKNEGFIICNAYYGTSTYNAKQMSRFINMIVFDCKVQGIDTATPEELARMVEEWKQ